MDHGQKHLYKIETPILKLKPMFSLAQTPPFFTNFDAKTYFKYSAEN